MDLFTTNDPSSRHSWRDAVLKGLAPDGGLYFPATLPRFSPEEIDSLRGLSFSELAWRLARHFLSPAVPAETLHEICHAAFSFPLPLHKLNHDTFILELFHGPTCAFKDFGARFMARLFRHFLGAASKPLTVVVATSGDTGSAVANAFLDTSPHPPIKVAILFPKGKVSLVQEKQMTTLGHNITAYEVDGSFDDCQAIAKRTLADADLATHQTFTSANSINIARLLPQMFYYVHAALALPPGTRPIFSVPSGNLGNLTGGLIGHAIGMPAQRFIAACNKNAPFPHYLLSGSYAPHPSYETLSNAMDVGNPSNYARVLALYHHDLTTIRATIEGDVVSDDETIKTIAETYRATRYVLDPHTAVGMKALENYRARTGDSSPAIVLATAHPAKFSATVERAIGVAPEIPPQLAEALEKRGAKISVENSYEDFRKHFVRAAP